MVLIPMNVFYLQIIYEFEEVIFLIWMACLFP